MRLFYLNEPNTNILNIRDFEAWESNSLPLGNGYFGSCVFGLVNKDRIQITENSLCNPYDNVAGEKGCLGLMSFCDILFDYKQNKFTNYQRELDLDNALFKVSYQSNGVNYLREAFTSYPDHLLAIRIKADQKASVSFDVALSIPFIGTKTSIRGCNYSRNGEAKTNNNLIEINGELSFYHVKYYGVLKVLPSGGEITIKENSISVRNADEVTVLFTCGTNYKLSESVFLNETNNKVIDYDFATKLKEIINTSLSFDELFVRHKKDYQSLFNRVSLNIGGNELPTDMLVEKYCQGSRSIYLENLLYHYGRYLLICSSRKGGLPANLQGIWSSYDSSPWSAGYWHNINVQMNYWPAFNNNLLECFIPYSDFNQAYMKAARKNADKYIEALYPEKLDNDNGWTIGTGGWPYLVEGLNPKSHSGPGTGAFTSLLFWDYYEFSQDKKYLNDIAYPVIYGMSKFLYKTLIKDGYAYLVKYSASPENIEHENSAWNDYHHTKGCAFDQQMIYENFKRTIECSELLGNQDKFIDDLKMTINKLEPVLIGDSGQIKEYREEHQYAEFGERHHRHISQLVGLYPGTLINQNTKEWFKAAETTLNLRGDESTGWAIAHRILAWSRIKNSSRLTDLLLSFMSHNVLPNLWDCHPPFQIDGNFGYTAAVGEMLVQSHEGFIDLLPCLPLEWDTGSFKGLLARGNFEISAEFKDRKLVKAIIKSNCGGKLRILNKGYSLINNQRINNNDEIVEINTNKFDTITIIG